MSESSTSTIVDAEARARALDPTQSFIVQAPAGSGKTELLTQRYLRLLTTVDHPEQVLAITFTRKASAEMRARIVKALELAENDAVPIAAHTRLTWTLARAVRARDRELNWHLAQHPARLRIQTIDALTGMLARRLPILSGIGAAFEPVDDAQSLYELACERLFARLGDGSVLARHLEALIVHLGHRVDQLLSLLRDLLARRDQWLHALMYARASHDLRGSIERVLRAVIERHLSDLCTALSAERRREIWELTRYAARNLLDNGVVAERHAVLNDCLERDVPHADADCFAAWRAVADVFLTREGQFYRQVTKRQGFPPGNGGVKARMERMLEDLTEDEALCSQLRALRVLPGTAYDDAQWRMLESLFAVLPEAVAELQIVFQQQGRADHVESAIRALRALGSSEDPTDLALALDYRLKHILVDEFQDTSFTQLDLLERLTAGWVPGDGRTLFCVGDPMQSIYRFRQAEVGLFLELQQRGLKHLPLEPLMLQANFRSRSAIVEWVNAVFPLVFPSRDAPEDGAVKYSPSAAARTEEGGGVHVHASIEATPLATAGRIVDIVRESLAADADSTIAILVAARTHVGAIATQLQRAGIEYRAVEIEPLLERPVVQDLIALTRALVHLADRTAWLAVLRAPWCGLTLADLHVLAADDGGTTIRSRLEAVRDGAIELSSDGHARAMRTFAVLERALTSRSRLTLRDWIERTWNSLGGPATRKDPQDLADAEAYFRRLESLDEAGDLEDVTRLEEQLEGLCARPRTQNLARVDIMTIHKAKGLEFDTVIVPGLERTVRGQDRPLLRWTRVVGIEDGIVLAPLSATGADNDPLYRWVESLEQQRGEHERARLLYVAATRAKRHLHLLGTARLKRKNGEISVATPDRQSMLWRIWHEVRPAFEAELQERSPQEELPIEERRSVLLKRLPLDWQLPTPDAPVALQSAPRVDHIVEQPEFDWASETARHIGTLVHRELDRMSRSGRLQAAALNAARPRLMAELSELGIPSERCALACDRVIHAIENTLADERGRWLLGVNGDVQDVETELALSGVIYGEIVHRVIDRTFRDAHGTRWIVDFKTSTHEGAGLDAFLDEEVVRYRSQLQRYAQLLRAFRPGESVKAALYFPLLKAWREVEV